MTPSGIEPATFRFVAQRLNHCATAVPQFLTCTCTFHFLWSHTDNHIFRRHSFIRHTTWLASDLHTSVALYSCITDTDRLQHIETSTSAASVAIGTRSLRSFKTTVWIFTTWRRKITNSGQCNRQRDIKTCNKSLYQANTHRYTHILLSNRCTKIYVITTFLNSQSIINNAYISYILAALQHNIMNKFDSLCWTCC